MSDHSIQDPISSTEPFSKEAKAFLEQQRSEGKIFDEHVGCVNCKMISDAILAAENRARFEAYQKTHFMKIEEEVTKNVDKLRKQNEKKKIEETKTRDDQIKTGIMKKIDKNHGPAFATAYNKKTGKFYTSINIQDHTIASSPKITDPTMSNEAKKIQASKLEYQDYIDSNGRKETASLKTKFITENLAEEDESYQNAATYLQTRGAGSHAEILASDKALSDLGSSNREDILVDVVGTGGNINHPAGEAFYPCADCSRILHTGGISVSTVTLSSSKP